MAATLTLDIGPTPASMPTLGTIYSILMLPVSLVVGLSLLPGMVIGGKTLRWLLVSPASLGNILLGKVLVTLAYQLLLSGGIMALLGGLGGTIPLLLLYILLGACL